MTILCAGWRKGPVRDAAAAAGKGARFLVHLHALVIGVWRLAEPTSFVPRIVSARIAKRMQERV